MVGLSLAPSFCCVALLFTLKQATTTGLHHQTEEGWTVPRGQYPQSTTTTTTTTAAAAATAAAAMLCHCHHASVQPQ